MNEIKFNDEIFAKIIDLNHLENGLNFFLTMMSLFKLAHGSMKR